MADGGASNMIMLVAALLVAGVASAVLIQTWAGTAGILSDNQAKSSMDSKTKVSFSGDLMQTEFDDNSHELVIYLQNSGSSVLEQTKLAAFFAGESASVLSTTYLNGATIWGPGVVLKATIQMPAAVYVDGEEFRVTVVVSSTASMGAIGTDTATEVVRLG